MIREDAIYARQSVDRMDSISIESQIEFCQYEARGNPYRVYADRGYSGKNTERPKFQELLADIRKGEIRRVICYKLDRCSRSILDFANMMDQFQQYHVEFVSCTEKFDTSSPMGRAMLNICIVFAQLERETIQQRVADAYHSRSQRGFYMGGRIPYGFGLEPYLLQGKKTSRYVPCPEEAEQVRLIYAQYAEPQVSVGDILKSLTENGIQNTRTADGHWSRSYITSILKNPIYVKADLDIFHFFSRHGANILNGPEDFIGTNGCYLFTDTGERRKILSVEGHALVLAPHEGLIPSDVWLKCRKKCMNNRQAAKPIKAKNTWLAGKIKCRQCGYALVVRKSGEKRYLMCSRHLASLSSCEGVGALDADRIEGAVLDAMAEKIAVLGPLSSQAVSYEAPGISAHKIRIAQCRQQIDSLLSKLPQADAALMGYINEKITLLNSELESLKQELAQLEDRQRGRQGCPHEIANPMELWEKLSTSDKITVVDAMITSIRGSKAGVSILWKL